MTRSGALGLALALASGCAAHTSDGTELEDPQLTGPWVFHEAEPEPCGMAFDPDPEILEPARLAAARWAAATGCDITIGADGLPIVLADASAVTLADGTPRRAVYDADVGEIRYRRGSIELRTAETMLAHELGHALGMLDHDETGLMAETTELGALIDAAALEGVCAALACRDFLPEFR
jgi:hypothetical protein